MQMQCEQCTTRTFYIMMQDNGSIEAYCTTNNHQKLLVNIPELAQAILNGVEEMLPNAEKLKVTVASYEDNTTDTTIQRDPSFPSLTKADPAGE